MHILSASEYSSQMLVKPDKGDKVAFANSLTSKKEQEKEGKNEQ